NISNNTLIGSSAKQWRKTDGLQARSAARELELQQKLKLQAGLKDKENNNNNNEHAAKYTTTVNLSDSELSAKKKEFTHCVFYLDNLEASAKASLERAIVLLGASQEKFFSNKCTHLITTKSIPIQENMLQSLCDTNASKQRMKPQQEFKSKDAIVDNALSWGIVLWSLDVMLKTVDYFMKASPFKNKNKQLQEKKALGKVLQEEKLFGPSTGVNSETQAKRPHFVAYTGYYLTIEDASQVHRPVISREYTKEMFKKKPNDYPWPFLKVTPVGRSPFGKRQPHSATSVAPKKGEEENDKAQLKSPPQTPTNTSTAAAAAAAVTTVTTATTATTETTTTTTAAAATANITPCTPTTTTASYNITTPPATPVTLMANPDSQYSLRASGFQQSCTNTNNTQSASTRSVSTMQNEKRIFPPGESVNRLDKRMVENVTQNEHQKMLKQVVKAEKENKENRARKEKEKKKDLRYCENCNSQFEKLEDHMKDPTHQTFIRDQNNFKILDDLLEKTHRVYKAPLPDHWKNLVEPSIDGKNVRFMSDLKRPRPESSESPNKMSTANILKKQKTAEPQQKKGWGKYHNVFL
ncbi:hypothetical protein INT47_004095, partial [Mucor saturninus]